VEAGLAKHPLAWPWSSSAASAGLSEPPIPLDPAPLQAALGDGADWRRRYRDFIEPISPRRSRGRRPGQAAGLLPSFPPGRAGERPPGTWPQGVGA
jgi:hypothetical protein